MTRFGATGSPLLVALLLALAPADAGAGDGASRVAVLGTSAGESVPADAVAAVTRAAIASARKGGAVVVTPDELASAASGAVPTTCGASASCSVAVCGAAGADALLIPKLKDTGTFWYVEMRLRDGRRGSVRGQAGATVAREVGAAEAAATRLADQVLRALNPGDGLPPPVMASPAAPSRSPGDVPTPPPRTARPPDLSPAPRVAAHEERGAAPEVPPLRPVASARGRWGVLLTAGGAALLAGGAATGAIAWSQSNAANASLARGDLGSFVYARQSSQTFALTAAGLGAAGAIVLGTGAWLWLGDAPAQVTLDVQPGAAAARLAIAF